MKGRSGSVTLRFEVSEDEGELWADLISAEPKGSFGAYDHAEFDVPLPLTALSFPRTVRAEELRCCFCHPSGSRFQRILNDDPFVAGEDRLRYVCDACSVEEHVSCIGANDFLEQAGVTLKRGILEVRGHLRWEFWSSPDGDQDNDEEFIMATSRWLPGVER